MRSDPHTKGVLQNPTGIKVSASRPVYQAAAAQSWWWTDARKAKLRYVMEKYNDLDKAARVLGCTPDQAKWRWRSGNMR